MQFNAASTSSSFAAAPATAATHNYFGAAVDVDGFRIPQVPLAVPSHQPIESNFFTKIPGLLSPARRGRSKEASRICKDDRFPSPEGSNGEGDAFDDDGSHLSPHRGPKMQSLSRVARSVAPSPAPSTLPQLHEDIERLYALEAEQAAEIRTLARDVLVEAFKICLSTPGDLANRYRHQIVELLGDGMERIVVEDANELRETGRLPERQPAWDIGYSEPRLSRTPVNVTSPRRSSMPPPSFIPSRKRLREEDSLEDVLEVENSLSLSRNASINTISSNEDSPASKRPRLETYKPTIDESEEDTMLGLIWGRT
ncbi:hypothetical protein NLJ89_g12205 [Agrocybe chaxingu]|uniref:Uncharacterized protein n=1 Tax=Agrocybe chaxingu TaxID=84603 RepID=A0A9W8MQF9_9AGAR|nr:hypothetical protein NLJ89_g12205 [Agrocybe chaxingu]